MCDYEKRHCGSFFIQLVQFIYSDLLFKINPYHLSILSIHKLQAVSFIFFMISVQSPDDTHE